MSLRTEIYINNTKVDLIKDIPFILNFQIADIKKPEQRKTSTSYSVILPASPNNNKLFSYIFEISKEILSTNLSINFQPDFNPNLKADAIIYVDSVQIFKGIMKLNEVNVNNNNIEYSVNFLGEFGNVFNTLNNVLLTDLNMGENVPDVLKNLPSSVNTIDKVNTIFYNIYFDYLGSVFEKNMSFDEYLNIIYFNSTFLKNYYYKTYKNHRYNFFAMPLIDNGHNDIETEFKLEYIYPAFSLKSYIYTMIEDYAGYNIKSNFFENDKTFNQLIIPFINDYSLSANEQLNRTAIIGVNQFGNIVQYNTRYNGFFNEYNGRGYVYAANSYWKKFDFTNENLPYYDTSNLYDINNGYLTIKKQGTYNININLYVDFRRIYNFLGVDYKFDWLDRTCNFKIINTNTNQVIATGYPSNQSNDEIVNYVININKTFNSGDSFRLELNLIAQGHLKLLSNNSFVFLPNNLIPFNPVVVQPSSFKLSPANTNLSAGDIINDLNAFIPRDIKCVDVLQSTIKMFNLMIDVDKEDITGKTLLIEPFNNFYDENIILNWNDKLDKSKKITIKPISEIKNKTYSFKYKKDSDYYNNQYSLIYNNEIYGEYKYEIDNDFVQNENKNEISFSPTPSSKYITSEMILPKIYSADGVGKITPRNDNNIRVLYFNAKNKENGKYTIVATDSNKVKTNTNMTEYNFCGMVDKPQNPTIDIGFGTPRQIFWSNVGKYTNNNLFNNYYLKQINEITNKNSKLVTYYIYLTPLDIFNFKFNNVVQIDGINYKVNRISNYNPLSDDSTQVELFKLIEGNKFSPIDINLENETANINDDYYIIDNGLDTVRSIQATSIFNIIDNGLDTINGIGSLSPIKLIDNGQNSI